jgi:hypothetical protein
VAVKKPPKAKEPTEHEIWLNEQLGQVKRLGDEKRRAIEELAASHKLELGEAALLSRQLANEAVASHLLGGGGGKLSRSEVVTVRLDPKLRYLAELAARKQRRTLSSFIEWAIEQSLADVKLTETSTVADEAPSLWDVDECDRFVKLALRDESLLNYREQLLWKRIQEHEGASILTGKEREIDWKRLRIIWTELAAVAQLTGAAEGSTPKEK